MVGERLKQIRLAKGLSQKAFADAVGTSSGYISEIEQGKKMPGSEFLLSLKREFAVNLDWFLSGEGGPQALLVAGNRISQYRNTLRLKPKEFAGIVGFTSGHLSDIESQKVVPSADDLEAIIQNTDVNPQWLSTGTGPERKGDNRTGDGRPFYALEEEAADSELRWKILEVIQRVMASFELDIADLSEEKRLTLRDLLYEDAIKNARQPNLDYASKLCRLMYCEKCAERTEKEQWQHKWQVFGDSGIDVEQLTVSVKAAPGLKCPMEGMRKQYIDDTHPQIVHCTRYYRRRINEGSLIILQEPTKG